MASLIYNSMPDDMAKGNVDFNSDDFAVMLVTSGYVENKDTHTRRSDVTNEVTGGSYPAGGVTVAVTVTKDVANDKVTIVFGQATFAGVSITARKAIYYKKRGGLAADDELIACNDFGVDKTITGGDFIIEPGTITIQN